MTASTFVAALLAADVPPPAASEAYYVWAGIALVITAIGGVVAAVGTLLNRRDTKRTSAQQAETTQQVTAINKAVNNVPPGDPSLIELVRVVNQRVDDTNAQVAAMRSDFSALSSAVHEVLNRSTREDVDVSVGAHPSQRFGRR